MIVSSTVWEQIRGRIEGGDATGLATLIAGLGVRDLAELTAHLDGYRPPYQPIAPVPELRYTGRRCACGQADEGVCEYRRRHEEASGAAAVVNDARTSAALLAVVACAPSADDAVRLLHRPADLPGFQSALPGIVPGLRRARGNAWCAALARALERRTRPRTQTVPWAFTEALLRATGAGAPGTPAAVAQFVRAERDTPIGEDPWCDDVLPKLFDDDVVADAFASSRWPAALPGLAATGRVDRAWLIARCLLRLEAGGRTGVQRACLGVLRDLAPTAGELAAHTGTLIGLLSSPVSTVAGFAYAALREDDRTDRLADITRAMLSRPERTLVRAHLTYLDRLRPMPVDDLIDELITGLHHPVPELASRTLETLLTCSSGLSDASRERLAAEIPALDGPVAARLAAVLGATAAAPPPRPVLGAFAPPAAMPPPLSLDELVDALTVMKHRRGGDPVRHELVLAGLVRAAHGDRDRAARALEPLITRDWYSGYWPTLLAAVCGRAQRFQHAEIDRFDVPLSAFVKRRYEELITRLIDAPPPVLLATPDTVAGHLDPGRLLARLRAGGPHLDHDLTQALLRLPREIDPAVRREAATLTSPAGRRLAEWPGAIPPRTRIEETDGGPRIAVLDPGTLPPELGDERTNRQRGYDHLVHDLTLWPMITPSHREVAAAHLQPYVAFASRRGDPGTAFLPGLAAADGPPGPATASILAYTLTERRASTRIAAGDLLITLATRPGGDAGGVGEELGALAASGRVVLRRAVEPLAEALRAGAHDAVRQVVFGVLPCLPPGKAVPGLAELLTLAAEAVRGGGRIGAPPGLDVLAARPGDSRLAVAARDLAALVRAAES